MIHIKLDDGTGEKYDAELRGPTVLPSGEDCMVVTKSDATEGGQAAVLVKFDVQMPGGTVRQAQYSFTAREFLSAADAVRAAHPRAEDLEKPTADAGQVVQKFHRGVGWTAICIEKGYLVSVEGTQRVGIAFNDKEMLKMGPTMVDQHLGLRP